MASELKHTVMPSGGDFTTLSACIDHIISDHANLVDADVYALVEIDGTWSSADTTPVYIAGITTDATRYLSIYTTAAARHKGVWSTSYYQLNVANDEAIRTASTDFIRLDGLQLGVSAASANYQAPIYYTTFSAGAVCWISNCILRQCYNTSYRLPCVILNDADVTVHCWNSLLYGCGTVNHVSNSAWYNANGNANLYNSVFIGGKHGVYRASGTVVAKNCYAHYLVTSAYAGTITMTTCASSDTTGSAGLQSIAYDTDTFVNVTGSSENLHLAADGLSPLQGAGTDTSGDAAPLNFTTDIDGETRDATWDIGADAWYSAAPSVVNVVYNII